MNVALAQIHSSTDDPAGNLERHLEAIERARAAGAELVVFAELSLSGYLVDDPRAWVDELLEPSVEAVRAAAGAMTVVVGTPWPHASGRATNASVAITSEGVVGRQEKIYLQEYGGYTEGRRFARGERLQAMSIGGRRVAILICADAWYPVLGYAARQAGAELFLHPSASPVSGVSEEFASDVAWKTINRAQALYHASPVVFVNHTGVDRATRFWGGSSVVGPTGTELAQLDDAPQVHVVGIDHADTLTARTLLPMADDDDTDLAIATADARRAGKPEKGATQ